MVRYSGLSECRARTYQTGTGETVGRKKIEKRPTQSYALFKDMMEVVVKIVERRKKSGDEKYRGYTVAEFMDSPAIKQFVAKEWAVEEAKMVREAEELLRKAGRSVPKG